MADVTARIQIYGLDNAGSPAWIDLADALVADGIRHEHGINGTTTVDLVAGPGQLTFDVDNGPANTVAARGAYAFGHASARVGWLPNAKARVVYTFNAVDYIGWSGRLSECDPDPEYVGDLRSHVVATDHMADLLDADLLKVEPQIDRTDAQLMTAILDAIPVDLQPPARDLDADLDTYRYALYKLGQSTKAVTAIRDVLVSGLHMAGTARDGTFRFINRQTRFTSSPIGSLDDTKLTGLSAPSLRDDLASIVKGFYHPPAVDPLDVVLWEQTSSAIYIESGATFTDTVTYRDPNELSRIIGAFSHVAVASGAQYVGNEAENGSGDDLTASLIVTRLDWSTTSDWSIKNNGTVGVWITTRRVLGKGIYDDDSPFVTWTSAHSYGAKPFEVDLTYQGDWRIAQGIVDLIGTQLEIVGPQSAHATFLANESDALMLLALTAEFGDTIAITNANTGQVSMVMEIRRIELELQPGNALWCTFELALTTSLTVPPTAPTGLAVSNFSDSELRATWTNTDVTSSTAIFANGVLMTYAPPGATAITVGGLTRATNYTMTAKHVRFALIYSTATAGVVGRPTVTATGGTITTPGDGYKYHTVTSGLNFNITGRGRIDFALVGGGAGAGGSSSAFFGGGGGGGGEVVIVLDNDEPTSASQGFPSGFPVTIGAGGAGAATVTGQGSDGGDTGYRSTGVRGGGGGGSYAAATSHNGRSYGTGGGGSGDGGLGAASGGTGFAGGDGGGSVGGINTGGGGGGATGPGANGVTGGAGGSVGGAGGAGATIFGTAGYGSGGQGGGPAGASGASAASYGCGGAGNLNGNGGSGFQGVAIFRYLI